MPHRPSPRSATTRRARTRRVVRRPAHHSPDPDYMLSLERGLAAIRAFGDGRSALGAAEVSRATGMSRAAARRCLHTLAVLGYATGLDGVYRLTPGVLALGSAFLGSNTFARVAEPVLERIAEALHESSSAAVLDGDDVVYVARVATRRILSIGLAVGSRLPAACTSMGRAIIAFETPAVRARFLSSVRLVRYTPRTIVEPGDLEAELERVRRQGYAIVDEELEVGLRSLAVPVLGADGIAMGALNVGVHVARVSRDDLVKLWLPALSAGAQDISRLVGYR